MIKKGCRSSSIKTLIFALILIVSTLSAKNGYNYYYYANGDRYKKLNKTAIIRIAKEEVKRLALTKKIPKSWRYAPVLSAEKSNHQNSNDWEVSFYNEKIKKKKRATLYIFIDIYGEIKGENYTGH